MSHDPLDERRFALEEQFFKKQNEALTQKLKQAQQQAVTKETVRRLTGINNDQVLQALAAMNLGGTAAVVLALFPLVEVAWADGTVDPKERQVMLDQAANVGITKGSEAAEFLAHWLDVRPELTWQALWADYVRELVKTMKPEDRAALKQEVLGRARAVAEVSGGFLGLGWRVSTTKQRVIDTFEKAFA